MIWKLFIDDERDPVTDGWVVIRTAEEAIKYIEENGMPIEIAFDHDLGWGMSGHDFAKWIVEYDLDNDVIDVDNFIFTVHSMNPIGAGNIMDTLYGYLDHKRENNE